MEMDDWEFDLSDGVDPLEFYILDEFVLRDEAEETNNGNGGCLTVLFWLVAVPLLFKEMWL